MNIYPAIDLCGGKAVRLLNGDYSRMTVFGDDPVETAKQIAASGAERIHLVDLEGARDGTTPNLKTIEKIKRETGLFAELGGGIRTTETIRIYREIGVDRLILGTAAVTDPEFLRTALAEFGERIAVGVDLKDGRPAIRGWTETSAETGDRFCARMQEEGVKTLICTDISRDGAMKGTNRELYRHLCSDFTMNIIASGGVSDLEDIRALAQLPLEGAIIGKAWYLGAISLKDAIREAQR